MRGTSLLSQLLTSVVFNLDASCSFINASCVIGSVLIQASQLGIEVECKTREIPISGIRAKS